MSKNECKSERVFVIPDPHFGDQDDHAVALAAQLCDAFKPTRVIWLGDILDAGWASQKFRVDKAKIPGQFAKEVALWEKSREWFRASRVDIIPGNHDRRVLMDYRWDKPELQNWRGMSPEFIYCNDTKLNIHLTDINPGDAKIELAQGEFIATHGIYLGTTGAKREAKRWGTGGISAHNHQLLVHYERDYRRERVWVSSGHLQRNPAAYATLNDPAPQNWIHAVSVLYIEGNQYHVEPIPFTLRYRAMLNGRRYSA